MSRAHSIKKSHPSSQLHLLNPPESVADAPQGGDKTMALGANPSPDLMIDPGSGQVGRCCDLKRYQSRQSQEDNDGYRWLALYLPSLSVQLYERTMQAPLPLAVSEREQIIGCNAAARALGVRPGLPESAARALTTALCILRRQPAAERAALERLAVWALRFSDLVSLDLEAERPAALVLEARRSLRLFGGAEALHQRLSEEAGALGWRVRCVMAPTPTAALLLAKAGYQGLIPSWTALRHALAELPPTLLIGERRAQDDLASMGVRSIGALLRLPRAGLAERFGLPLLQRIERLLGERADPRLPFKPPERFQAELELPAEVLSTQALIFPCHRLVDELGAFLAARQAGVQRLHWSLSHAEAVATRFQLGSAQLERDPSRWSALLRERLEWLRLPQPVRGIGLATERLYPLPPTGGELLGLSPVQGVAGVSLIDRLRARLGEQAVRGLALVADHRPERAWRWSALAMAQSDCATVDGGTRSQTEPNKQVSVDRASQQRKMKRVLQDKVLLLARAERPLWLLPEPLLLKRRNGRPWLDGPLALGDRCERIETGWWDGFEIARDYYIATNSRGERLWIFREIAGERRWFLHGLMGMPAC
jgi:protein ImuB